MATAYTPGLTVSPYTVMRRTRRLPLKGGVVVDVGDEVLHDTVVARTELPGILRTVRAAERLGIDADELPTAARVSQGDAVAAGDLLAESRSFFGIFHSQCHAPVDGRVEIVNPVTGHISIRERAAPVEIAAYGRGRIIQVLPEEGVVVETAGALIQGIFGIGGERQGRLRMVAANPDQVLDAAAILPEMAGEVLVGGANVTGEALQRAADLGVAGIVVGAIIDADLIRFLGYDIGVAITGHEAISLTLVLTEGFGQIRMAQRTFELLRSLEGEAASLNGATQIRAGVIRPEIIVPRERPVALDVRADSHDLGPGAPIRIIREPYFGRLATVSALPAEPQEIPSGAHVRVLEAELESGEQVVVPRANVEIIQA
ncbi:MAG: hypothetical protein ACO1SX_26095 [Actinomycetota bacterium]